MNWNTLIHRAISTLPCKKTFTLEWCCPWFWEYMHKTCHERLWSHPFNNLSFHVKLGILVITVVNRQFSCCLHVLFFKCLYFATAAMYLKDLLKANSCSGRLLRSHFFDHDQQKQRFNFKVTELLGVTRPLCGTHPQVPLIHQLISNTRRLEA